MRRTVRTVTTILFLAVVVGCAFAVLYLGTSTGLTFGGSGSQLIQASKTNQVYAQIGWLRNTAPWPVTIENITTNEIGTSAPAAVMLEREQSGSKVSTGSEPKWAQNASHAPYQLDGGALRYLGFAVQPEKTRVGYMTSITVHFTGPLGIPFTSTFHGTTVVAEASSLPGGITARDPLSDSTSLDSYIAALRNAFLQADPAATAAIMGGGATADDGAALLKREAGYATVDSVAATPESKDRRSQKIVFYQGDPVKGGLPAISVTWSGFQWTVDRT
jgi:hypothetical protein